MPRSIETRIYYIISCVSGLEIWGEAPWVQKLVEWCSTMAMARASVSRRVYI